jgi:hypothetical protein
VSSNEPAPEPEPDEPLDELDDELLEDELLEDELLDDELLDDEEDDELACDDEEEDDDVPTSVGSVGRSSHPVRSRPLAAAVAPPDSMIRNSRFERRGVDSSGGEPGVPAGSWDFFIMHSRVDAISIGRGDRTSFEI